LGLNNYNFILLSKSTTSICEVVDFLFRETVKELNKFLVRMKSCRLNLSCFQNKNVFVDYICIDIIIAFFDTKLLFLLIKTYLNM
jgi:hypothetical protein